MAERGGTGRRTGRGSQDDSTTYCIRLNPRERELLLQAIGRMGWTPTHFVRQATLEKAAHVENTSAPKNFDFDRLARRLAAQLCEQPVVKIGHDRYPGDGLTDLRSFLAVSLQQNVEELFWTTEPGPLTLKEVEQVRRAGHLGGAQFLSKVLDECERLVSHQRTDLPPPVDPDNLGDGV